MLESSRRCLDDSSERGMLRNGSRARYKSLQEPASIGSAILGGMTAHWIAKVGFLVARKRMFKPERLRILVFQSSVEDRKQLYEGVGLGGS